jgi:acyl carrier protein
MSGREAIESKLKEFVASELLDNDDSGLTETTNLLALGVIDSLSMVSLRVFMERSFQVRVPDGVQPEDFATLSSMAAMVERLQRGEPASAKGR